MRKVYFAHPVSDYGGTERQSRAIATIEAFFAGTSDTSAFSSDIPFELVNPDHPDHQEGYRRDGMDYFRRLMDGCWHLIFMRFPDGSIGAGVGAEIKAALSRSITVYEVHHDTIYRPVDAMPTPVLTVEQTRATIQNLRKEPAHDPALNG